METQFNAEKVIKHGEIQNELDYERALIADRKLRVLAKDNPRLKSIRVKLRDLIEVYENKHWSKNSKIDRDKLLEGDIAESIAEIERNFLKTRKSIIKDRLQKIGISQQELGKILGHNSKSYMSELINGVSPFVLKDLVVINRLLKIALVDLIPTFLPEKERLKIKSSLQELNNPKLKLSFKDFELA